MGTRHADPFAGSPDVLRLPGATGSARLARAFVDGVLETWGTTPKGDVTLATSEVVTNAIVHTEGDISVRVRRVGGRARVEVHDHDPRPPQVRPYEAGRIGGAGMHVVSALTAGWGVTGVGGDGKIVWFEVELEPQR